MSKESKQYDRFHVDMSIKKASVDEVPLAFTRLKYEAVPTAGGCCVTSVFMTVTIYDRIGLCERECTGRYGRPLSSDVITEVIERAQPKGYKSWLASEWPVFRFIGASGTPDSEGDHAILAARLYSLEMKPSKYLTKGSGEIYRKWCKELYTYIEPWQADQWTYNALYRMQGAGSVRRCEEYLRGLPACMQDTLAACSACFTASKGDIKSIYNHICQ